MTTETYLQLKRAVIDAGHSADIRWAQRVGPPTWAFGFWAEYGFVVVNSGMKNTVAAKIWERILHAHDCGEPFSSAFGHAGKVQALEDVLYNRHEWFARYQEAEDKLAFLESMPWIGPITKYHLAKNLGLDYCKPDRHLVRIAKGYGLEVVEMCQALADATGDRIGTVDVVIWRAAAEGML